MSNKSGSKKYARDIQARTQWSYQFCLRLIETLGYEKVSDSVDEFANLAAAGESLNELLRAASNELLRTASKESKP